YLLRALLASEFLPVIRPKYFHKLTNEITKTVAIKNDFSVKAPLANNTTEPFVNLNENITKVLKALEEKEKKAGDIYRERAYRTAIESISIYSKRITSGEEARKLKGVGNGISTKIDEILKTGTCSQLWENDSDERNLINLFTKLPKIGRVKAKKLIDKGCKSLEDVANELESDSFTRIIIRHLEEFDKEIPRCELKSLQSYITQSLSTLDMRFISEACGSFRRGADTSKELNMLTTHPDFMSTTEKVSTAREIFLKPVLNHLKGTGFCIDYISKGQMKYNAICQLPSLDPGAEPYLHRRVEFWFVPYDQFCLAKLWWTGDDEFYKYLQKKARDKNYHLTDTVFAIIDPNTGTI
ncbi:18530_t:CDS:2, partial [Gigaspora margarita]